MCYVSVYDLLILFFLSMISSWSFKTQECYVKNCNQLVCSHNLQYLQISMMPKPMICVSSIKILLLV